jgi:hypothetical protein
MLQGTGYCSRPNECAWQIIDKPTAVRTSDALYVSTERWSKTEGILLKYRVRLKSYSKGGKAYYQCCTQQRIYATHSSCCVITMFCLKQPTILGSQACGCKLAEEIGRRVPYRIRTRCEIFVRDPVALGLHFM